MSNVYFTRNALSRLDNLLDVVHGKGAQKTSQAVAQAVVEGNSYDRVNGRTRYGTPVAPLKAPRRGKYEGKSGPPLAPSGSGSRVVTHFTAKARQRGGNWQVLAGWKNVTSKRGVPFLPFHDMGAARLPRRPIFGLSPRTWAKVREIVRDFVATMTRRR